MCVEVQLRGVLDAIHTLMRRHALRRALAMRFKPVQPVEHLPVESLCAQQPILPLRPRRIGTGPGTLVVGRFHRRSAGCASRRSPTRPGCQNSSGAQLMLARILCNSLRQTGCISLLCVTGCLLKRWVPASGSGGLQQSCSVSDRGSRRRWDCWKHAAAAVIVNQRNRDERPELLSLHRVRRTLDPTRNCAEARWFGSAWTVRTLAGSAKLQSCEPLLRQQSEGLSDELERVGGPIQPGVWAFPQGYILGT